jgi:hypothetical protein
MIPRCRPNSRVFFFIVTSIVYSFDELSAVVLYIIDTKIITYLTRRLSIFLSIVHGLKSLLLHRNKLDDPDGLEHLTNLETLSLATNKLRKFPHQVLALEKLTYLNLSNNHLGFVPASIKNLKNLEVLWLNSTGLTCLPQEMSELGKLETLGARHNELKALPHEFSELKSLRRVITTHTQKKRPDSVAILDYVLRIHTWCDTCGELLKFPEYKLHNFLGGAVLEVVCRNLKHFTL